MTGSALRTARTNAGWTQQRTAARLGVTQAYLSMLEREQRPVTPAVAVKAARHLHVSPTSLPFAGVPPKHFEDALGVLGYPGFAYVRKGRRYNPAELLLLALDTDDLPARAVEGLPWLPLAFPDLNWEWLLREAKLRNRQNRLGFILDLSAQAAMRSNMDKTAAHLLHKAATLAPSLLSARDHLCNASMTNAERKWLETHSSPMGQRWHLLSDLQLSHLDHVYL